MPEIGIAVSLYDKFDDLAVLHDILRHNFEDNYYLSVHCNHPDGKKEILEKRDLEIDHFSGGEEVKYREGTQKNMRILNSIKKSCKGAMEESNYVMHVHADAWPLSESKLKKIVSTLKDRDRKLAFRGKGATYRRIKGPLNGHVMDQFFVFESEYFGEIEFFNFDLLDPLPHNGIHYSLMLLFLGRVGRANMYRYSDFSSDLDWDGKKSKLTEVRPSIFNDKWKLLHCANDEFPGDYGKKYQAIRLKEENLLEGKYIEKLIQNHHMPEGKFRDELGIIEKQLDRQMKYLLIDREEIGRKFNEKQKISDKKLVEKAEIMFKNIEKKSYFGANKIIFSFLPFENPAKPRKSIIRRARWPKTTQEVYKNETEIKELGDSKIWFADSDLDE